MNILILCCQGNIAGSTLSISYLAKGLANRGHTVVVGCSEHCLLYSLLENTPVIRVPMTFRSKFDINAMKQVRDIVKIHSITIINAQSSLDRYISILSKWLYRFQAKVVHTRRQVPKSGGGILQAWFYTLGTTAIVAVSDGVKEALARMGIPKGHIRIIRNGTPREKYDLISPEKTEALRQKYGIIRTVPVVGCVSRRKKQNQLLQALSLLNRKVIAILVGADETEADRKILQRYDVDHKVFFTGLIPFEDSLNYYPLFTVNVLPSTAEGLPQALLEAMALGVPVIATRASGNVDLIRDGENGLLFDDGDIEGLAKKIEDIIEKRIALNTIIEKGRKTALEDFSIEKTVSAYDQLFSSLV